MGKEATKVIAAPKVWKASAARRVTKAKKGERGEKGEKGEAGYNGLRGIGIVAGGAVGQALVKKSGADFDTMWATISGGGGSSAWGGIIGVLSDQADLQSALDAKASISSLASVATAGTYASLTGKPTLFSGAYADLTGKPAYIGAGATAADARSAIGAGTSNLAIGSTSTTAKAGDWKPAASDIDATGTPSSSTYLRGDGSWASVSGAGDVVGPASSVDGVPVVFDGATGKLIKAGAKQLSTEDYSTAEKTKLSGISTGATANDTDANLKNRANHTGTQAISTVSGLQSALDSKANTSSLATVATSGSYADLAGKPSIPAAQVNSDWAAVSGVAQILNKPTLFSGAYADLTGKPTLGSAAAASTGDFATAAQGTAADAALPKAGGTMTGAITFAGAQTWPTFNQPTTGNAATATKLATARTIGGVSFDGSANINLPGVNTAGTQNTTGSAARWTTARTLTLGDTGKSVNGSANVSWTLAEIGAAPVNATLTDAAAASTLPATTATALTALLQTVRDCLKWLLANTLQLTGNQTAAGVKTFSDRSSHAGAYTPATQPAHSATPTFDCAVSNVFEPAAMGGQRDLDHAEQPGGRADGANPLSARRDGRQDVRGAKRREGGRSHQHRSQPRELAHPDLLLSRQPVGRQLAGDSVMSFAVRPIGLAPKRWDYVGAGAISNNSAYVAFPVSAEAGDLAVVVGSAASASSTPSGWSPMASGAPFHFYKVCAGGESSVTLSVAGYFIVTLFRPVGGVAYLDSGATTNVSGATTMTAPASASLMIAAPSVSVPDSSSSWTYTLPTTDAGNINAPGNHMVIATRSAQPQFAVVAANITPGASTGGMDVRYGSYTHRRTFGIWGIT